MTSLCFIHDAPLVEDTESRIVYSRGFPYEIWQRYRQVFDKVTVCTRMRFGVTSKGMGVSSGQGVSFQPADAYKNPLSLIFRFNKIYNQVAKAVSGSDAVILRLPSVLGLIGFVAVRRLNRPYLVELVGSPFEAYKNRGRIGRAIAPLMAGINRYVVKRAPYCIYVTESFLQEYYPTSGKSASISNVDVDTSNVPSERKQPSSIIRMGSSGKVDVPYKGYETVVRALDRVPNVFFEVAGGGESASLLSHAAASGVSDRVKALGRLNKAELFAWLDSLDLYIQPSYTEGLPRAVLEAMSRGLPVIASDVGGVPELLNPEFLFPAGDSEAIATKIETLLARRDFEEIGINNYERSKRYDRLLLNSRRTTMLESFRKYSQAP